MFLLKHGCKANRRGGEGAGIQTVKSSSRSPFIVMIAPHSLYLYKPTCDCPVRMFEPTIAAILMTMFLYDSAFVFVRLYINIYFIVINTIHKNAFEPNLWTLHNLCCVIYFFGKRLQKMVYLSEYFLWNSFYNPSCTRLFFCTNPVLTLPHT